jgi:hypothetical protein
LPTKPEWFWLERRLSDWLLLFAVSDKSSLALRRSLAAPVAILLSVVLSGHVSGASIISVPAGGDLQGAIDRAKAGDTITLAPGATYVGNFILRLKPGNQFITIRTEEEVVRPGQRVNPSHSPRLAKLRSPNRQPSLATEPGAHHWRLILLEFPPTVEGSGDIITLGDGSSAQSTLAEVPFELVIDRCYIYGDPAKGQKRGIALNSGRTVITNSYIADIKGIGQDTQAIGGWNGPGPYTIENNYLEAAGENFMLGGADPPIRDLVTSDVVFRRNHLAKPLEWRTQRWTVKNLFELKNARRVLVEENLMENCWPQGQAGYAILLTPRNQDGRAPWVVVEDITIRRNIVRHAGAGMQIIGRDTKPSGRTRRVRVSENLFYDIDGDKWGGNGTFALIGDGPSDITFEHNTIVQSGNIFTAYGGTREAPDQIERVVFRDNVVRHNTYGVHGDDRATGMDTFEAFFPGILFSPNGIAGGESKRYPPGNQFLSEDDFDRQFVDPRMGDYRLKASSKFRRAASDGRDLGADVAGLMQALGWRFRPQ